MQSGASSPPVPRSSYDGTAAAPLIATVETTRFCHLRCRMCIQFLTGSTVRGPHMSLEAFREIAAKVFPIVQAWQPSVSGEPLLTKGLLEMLALADEHGVQLDLTTSGTLWNDALRDAIARALRRVQFSFDSCEPAVFESIRRGARFAEVVANIRALQVRCRELRGDDMPRIGLSVTLMRANVDGLPDLVEFAARELQVDHMQVLHVFPVTDEVRTESLVHDAERARERIATAAARAEALGIDFTVHPLDDVTAATALDPTTRRAVGGADAPRLPGVEVAHVRTRGDSKHEPRPEVDVAAELPDRIGYCSFLWQRTYVQIGGDVLPCCVPGAPVVGSIWNGDLASIWNGALYRELRRRIVAQDPAPVCRGCRGYRVTDDRQVIARVLDGMTVPDPRELGACPAVLDPRSPPIAAGRTDAPPVLRWPSPVDPDAVLLEASTDAFVTRVFSSESYELKVEPDGWRIPPELWQQAPHDRTLFWRLLRRAAPECEPLATGRIGPQGREADPRQAAPRPR